MNRSINAHPSTSIGITFSTALNKGSISTDSISVTGSLGTKYSGAVHVSVDGKTLIFKPSTEFKLGETIQAHFGEFLTTDGFATKSYSLSFHIREKLAVPDPNFHSDDPLLELQLHKRPLQSAKTPTVQDLDPSLPTMNIIKDNSPSDGEMFLTNYRYVSDQANPNYMILDKNSNPLYAESGGPDYFDDFKPNLDGTYSYFDNQNAAFFILDSTLTLSKMVTATNGYVTDSHEIRLTPEGNYFIIGSDNILTDMTKEIIGGWSTANILVPIIQEFDKENNLIFEWRSIDHFKITDATHEDLTSDYIDFCHMNAIEFDADNNLLISSRHMDEITKINRETGDIMWRWGGKNNQFTFVGDTLHFSHQHSIRMTDAGTYTMFDNGNFRPGSLPYSRAIEYELDAVNKTAKRIWEFRHVPDVFSAAMGYVQRLPNQNTFIGWGELNNLTVTEVDLNNQTLFEMGMADQNYSYRAYKYDLKSFQKSAVSISSGQTNSTRIALRCQPNLISGNAKIQCTIGDNENIDVNLYDLLGKEVQHIYSGNLSPGSYTFPLNCTAMPEGVYYIRASISNAAPVTEKIMVVR